MTISLVKSLQQLLKSFIFATKRQLKENKSGLGNEKINLIQSRTQDGFNRLINKQYFF